MFCASCLHCVGDKYVGKFESGMQVGTGSLRFWNNDMYTGEWADTLPNGPGKVEFWGGDELAGDFADGQATGQGTLTCLVSQHENCVMPLVCMISWRGLILALYRKFHSTCSHQEVVYLPYKKRWKVRCCNNISYYDEKMGFMQASY